MEFSGGSVLRFNNNISTLRFSSNKFYLVRKPFLSSTSTLMLNNDVHLQVRGICCASGASSSEQKKMKESAFTSNDEHVLSSLSAISPLDGRYLKKVEELQEYFSEYGLIRYRVLVEVRWLLKLSEMPEIIEVPKFSDEAKSFLENLIHTFDIHDAWEVKKIESVTNHDVKAVEYFLKQKCSSHVEVGKTLGFLRWKNEEQRFASSIVAN